MISKDMYRLLKKFPRWPNNKTFDELDKVIRRDDFVNFGLLMNAKERGLVGCNGKEEDNTAGFYLTEEGKEAIDEYVRQRSSDRKATWALIIAGLSFVASVVAIIISIVQ
jgi:hypothetical protein